MVQHYNISAGEITYAAACDVYDVMQMPNGSAAFFCQARDRGTPAGAAISELISNHTAFLKKGRVPDDITLLLVHRPSG